MHLSVMQFFLNNVTSNTFLGKRVLEVGSYDVNGTVRYIVEKILAPSEYIGVDIRPGPCVDKVVSADKLVETFGLNSFDIVICTEMLEHAADWRAAINNMKAVLKFKGLLYLTTRSIGFPKHDYPNDYWRFSWTDMVKIFADFHASIVIDPQESGVFVFGTNEECEYVDLDRIEVSKVV